MVFCYGNPSRLIQRSNPCTSKWDFIWKWGHCRWNQLRWDQTGVQRVTGILKRREKRLRDTANTIWQERHRLNYCSWKVGPPRTAGHHWKLEIGKKGFSSTGFRGVVALSTSCLYTSSLQNFETENFCCFKPLILGYFLLAALGINTIA